MSNKNLSIAPQDEPHPDHRHDGVAIRATIGNETGGVRIDYVCRECGAAWSEIRPRTADQQAVVPGVPSLRRRSDRRKPG